MDINRFRTIKVNLELDPSKRILVISDIHGNYDLLLKILKQVNYQPDDYLIILGDIIERGQKNILTVRYLKKLAENPHVHIIMGNNDYRGVYQVLNSTIYQNYCYFISRANTLLREMFLSFDLPHYQVDFDIFKEVYPQVLETFKEEIDFVANLPHMIETQDYWFCHSGIDNECNLKTLLEADLFYQKVLDEVPFKRFEKTLIVGHYPTSGFRHQISSYDPIIDLDHNIILIDGGNTIKSGGQLNCLIIKDQEISFESADFLEEVTVIKKPEITNNDPVSWIWNQDQLTLIKDYGQYGLYQDQFGHQHEIDYHFIYQYNNKTYCYDDTNNQLNPDTYERIKIIYRFPYGVFGKFKGQLGFIDQICLEDFDLKVTKIAYNEIHHCGSPFKPLSELYPDSFESKSEFYRRIYDNQQWLVIRYLGNIVGHILVDYKFIDFVKVPYIHEMVINKPYDKLVKESEVIYSWLNHPW